MGSAGAVTVCHCGPPSRAQAAGNGLLSKQVGTEHFAAEKSSWEGSNTPKKALKHFSVPPALCGTLQGLGLGAGVVYGTCRILGC